MAITSSSTPAEIENEYLDCLSYDTPPGDTAKCHRFIAACRAILLRRPSRMARNAAGGGSQDLTWDLESVRLQLEEAKRWLAFSADANTATGGGVSFASFQEFRDF